MAEEWANAEGVQFETNKKMKTVKIKGKEYVEVPERIKFFRNKYPNWSLVTEIVQISEERVIIMAKVLNEDGVVKSTGFAYEDKDSTFINKTSYIENCETSAIGRALGNFGIGLIGGVASAEEVINAVNNQPKKMTKNQRLTIIEHMKVAELEINQRESIEKKMENFTEDEANKCIKFLESKR